MPENTKLAFVICHLYDAASHILQISQFFLKLQISNISFAQFTSSFVL